MHRVVVLLSGGLDSALVLAQVAGTCEVFALGVHYGQRNAVELQCARWLARHYQCAEYLEARVSSSVLGGGLLNSEPESGPNLVGGRNLVLLAMGCSYARRVNASQVLIGCNRDDAREYPDCSDEFLQAASRAVALDWGPSIVAPLLDMGRAEILKRAVKLGVPLEHTLSCYDPTGEDACGRCAACERDARAAAAGWEKPCAHT